MAEKQKSEIRRKINNWPKFQEEKKTDKPSGKFK